MTDDPPFPFEGFTEKLYQRLDAQDRSRHFIVDPARPGLHEIIYTSAPGDPGSWVKDRFVNNGTRLTDPWEPWDGEPVDTTRRHTTEFTVYAGDDIDRALRWDVADRLTADTHRLIRDWAHDPPDRPGWTGSVTGPPPPIPLMLTPWQTLPKGVSDGGRTIIIEPGADTDPDARLMKLEYGRWRDVGPAHPHGIAPAHRGRPAPIPWDSPLADPVADMKRTIEENNDHGLRRGT